MSDDTRKEDRDPNWMKTIPLFSDVESDRLKEIEKCFVIENVDANQIVVDESTSGDAFFVIVKGSVEISKSKQGNERKRLTVLKDGDFFGEIALIEANFRTARASTLEATTVLVLHRNQFFTFLSLLPPATRTSIINAAKERRKQLLL